LDTGLTLIAEGIASSKRDIARAVLVRNGFMVALLALYPIRLKNFAALDIGTTFKQVEGSWWIILPSSHTKSRRPDERRVTDRLNWAIEAYLNQWRPVLIESEPLSNRLWISSTTGCPLTYRNLGTLVSKITRETLGIDVSLHLFRTAAASTAAIYGPTRITTARAAFRPSSFTRKSRRALSGPINRHLCRCAVRSSGSPHG
jgi:hypothetical protein